MHRILSDLKERRSKEKPTKKKTHIVATRKASQTKHEYDINIQSNFYQVFNNWPPKEEKKKQQLCYYYELSWCFCFF